MECHASCSSTNRNARRPIPMCIYIDIYMYVNQNKQASRYGVPSIVLIHELECEAANSNMYIH